MAILTNDVDTQEYGPRIALRLAAGIGYNSQLFRGGLWELQTQAVGTVGSGNAAVTGIARGTVPVQISVILQAASQPLSHTYVGGLLTILPATNATPALKKTIAWWAFPR